MLHSFVFLSSLLTLALTIAVPPSHLLDRHQDGPVAPLTTYLDYTDCSDTQKDIINQASADARALADAALEDDTELSSLEHYHKTIDFSKRPALDFFGNNAFNVGEQEKIITALYRSSVASPTFRWDWWNDRYVSYSCKDWVGPNNGGCIPTAPAYTSNSGVYSKYPVIVFCDAFFTKLKSHGDQVAAIKADTTGQMKLNLRNIRSRATTTLHEWQHITDDYDAWTCKGGIDTFQLVGPPDQETRVRTYKPGRAKLLASKDVAAAANTNDNYAYFATPRWMEKNFNVYPEYPHGWDDNKTVEDNQANEDKEPGAPQGLQVWELEDAEFQLDDGHTGVTNRPINVPAAVIAAADQGYLAPATAFANVNLVPNAAPVKGKNKGTWWAGFAKSCAIGIQYDGDWDNSCTATLGDVRAHADAIVQMCGNGPSNVVGGHVSFAVKNCPARIAIFKADGAPPSGTR